MADRREVGIYYNRKTQEYMVRLGTETEVAAFGRDWYPLVHYQPNPTGALTFRLPSQMDFDSMYLASGAGPVRQFVEFDIPGVGRGRTEFGIDLASSEPVYVRIHHPNGDQQTIRFRDTGDYATYWGERAIYVEPDSPVHKQMLDDIGQWIRERRGASGELEAPKARAARWRGLPDGIRRARRPHNATSRATAGARCAAGPGARRSAALSEPPTSAVVDAAKARFDAGQAQPGDLGIIMDKATADMRAVIELSEGGLGPAACADYCNLAARGVVPTSILALLKNGSQSVRVDAISAQVLARSFPRPSDQPLAAHQFGIIRAPAKSRIVDTTFAQFLQPGSPDVKQGGKVLPVASSTRRRAPPSRANWWAAAPSS